MARVYEILMRINGMLDKSLLNALKNANESVDKLGNKKSTRSIQELNLHAKAFQILRDASQKAAGQIKQNRLTYAQLNSQMQANREIAQRISQQYQTSKTRTDELKSQKDQLKSQKATLQMQLKGLQEAGVSKQSEAYKTLQERIRATNAEIRNLNASYRASSNETKQFARANRQAQNELQRMENDLRRSQENIEQLRFDQIARSQQMAGHQRAMRESGFNGNFEDQRRRIEDQSRRRENYENARNQVSERYQKIQNAYGNFQDAQGIAESIMSPFTSSLELAMEFEQSTARVKAIMGGGENVDMSKIVETAKKLGMETNFTASEAMNAAYYAAIAGWKEEQIVAAMPTALNLANAGDIGIDKAMDIVSDEMTAFGLDTSKSEVIKKYADQFAYTISNANTDAEQLHEAMKYAAPAMHAAEISAEQSFAIAGMMANAGIKGSSAGTAMRKWALNTIDRGQVSEELLAADGLTMSDLTKQQLEAQQALSEIFSPEQVEAFMNPQDGMIKMLTAFAKAGEGKSAADRAAMLRPLTGLTAFSGMESVIEAAVSGDMGDASSLEKLFNGIMNQEDTAAKISAVMLNTAQGDRALYESAVAAFQQNIGEVLIPAMRELLTTITPIIAGFAEWARQNPEIVKTLAMIAAGISAILVVCAGLALFGAMAAGISAGISAISAGMGVLAGVAGAVSLPILGIIAAVIALAGLAYYVYSNWESIGPMLAGVWETIKSGVISAFESVKEKLSGVIDWISEKIDSIKELFAPLLEIGSSIMSTIGGTISSAIEFVVGGSETPSVPAVMTENIFPVENMQAFDLAALNSSTNMQDLDISMQAFGLSTQTTATNMQAFDQATQTTATNMQAFDQATQTTATNMQAFDQATQTTATNMQAFDQATQTTGTAMQAFGQSTQFSAESLNQLGASSDQVAMALSSKAAEIAGIQISAPTISIPASGVQVAHNALGGIYPRGEFLTTFAENSAEAAIPLDGSSRAKSLWIQAGQILGMFPEQNSAEISNPINPLQPINPINESTSTISNSNPVFNLTMNVSGESKTEEIAVSMRESFEEMWRSFQYERERVAFN